jgi:hypothetical protein
MLVEELVVVVDNAIPVPGLFMTVKRKYRIDAAFEATPLRLPDDALEFPIIRQLLKDPP